MRGIDSRPIPQSDDPLVRFADRHPKWDKLDQFLLSLPAQVIIPLVIAAAIVTGLVIRVLIGG